LALTALLGDGTSVLIVTDANAESLTRLGAAIHAELVPIGLLPIGQLDRRFCDDTIWKLHAGRFPFVAGTLDFWLREVADEKQVNTLFINESFTRLVHPYDGGMDLILADVGERDAFTLRFGDWLSARPDGY
jgi:hypothetical protein